MAWAALVLGVGVGGECHGALANDNLSSAAVLAGGHGTVNGTTLGASLEVGEPLPGGLVSSGSVWYRWAAFSGGNVVLQAVGSGYTARIAVYRQTDTPLTYGHLQPVTSGSSGAASFTPIRGSVYYITVAAPLRGSGPFTLAWTHTPPAGGGIDLAIVPGSARASVVTRNFDATECDVVNGCALAGTNRLIMIDFEVANRGTEDFYLGDPTRSPLASTMACYLEFHFNGFHRYVLRDAKNQVVVMSEPQEHCFKDSRRESPTAAAVGHYDCSVQGLSAGWVYSLPSVLPCHYLNVSDVGAGSYTLEITVDPWNWVSETDESNNTVRLPVVIEPECTASPVNDNRTQATVITGAIASTQGNSECATVEPGEKPHTHFPSMPAGRSIWYQWTAPYTGPVVATTEGSNYDTVLEVQGPAPEGSVNGPYLAFNDDATLGVGYSRLQFDAVFGTTYWFVVDGYNVGAGSEGGRVVLNLNPASNNAFSDAQDLPGVDGVTSGNSTHADRSAGEPALSGNAGGHLVWFHWFAAAPGPMTLDTDGSSYKTLMGVFTGAGLETLSPAAGTPGLSPSGAARFAFQAEGGRDYYIALDGAGGAAGLYKLLWHQVPETPVEVRLTAQRDAGGTVRLQVTGRAGQSFSIQRSTNLKDWTEIGTATVNGASASYLDAAAPGSALGFYKAVGK
jgi:hypothetical protein